MGLNPISHYNPIIVPLPPNQNPRSATATHSRPWLQVIATSGFDRLQTITLSDKISWLAAIYQEISCKCVSPNARKHSVKIIGLESRQIVDRRKPHTHQLCTILSPDILLSSFLLPKGVIKKIDQICHFLWHGHKESQENSMPIHLANWGLVTRSKKLGRMGIRDMSHVNSSLLVKWMW
jgi:hypothetical protein